MEYQSKCNWSSRLALGAVPECDWDTKLVEIIDKISFGNDPKTKILVMSDHVAWDEEKIEVLKASSNVKFAPVLDLKEEEHFFERSGIIPKH